MSHSFLRQLLLMLLAFPVIIASLGCDRGPKMAKVSGKVFYKDGSVPNGGISVVRFEPADGSTATVRQGASGAINRDGSFEMSSRVFGDGVHYGDYVVTFGVLKSPTDPTSLIKPEYANRTTSPYKVTIDGDKSDLEYTIEPLPGVAGTKPASPAGGSSG